MKRAFITTGFALICIAVLAPVQLSAGQPLETETARLLDKGKFKFESTFEYQTSSEGKETALPTLFEYGISRRLELAVEPVLNAAIHPKTGRRATGIGDIEATLTYLLAPEASKRPALALAAEVKIPTAEDRLIGTDKADFTTYGIVSRRFSKLDAHFNLGYSILGEPNGVALNNIFSFALAGEYHASPRWDLVGEVFANTSAAPGIAEGVQPVATGQPTEIAGSEAFGMLGIRWYAGSAATLAFGIVYDNNNALLFRPGITFKF